MKLWHIRYKWQHLDTNNAIEHFVSRVAGCFNNHPDFEPYRPNEHDWMFWTLDQDNDWKIKLTLEGETYIVEILHRYQNLQATEAVTKWIAYRTGGIFVDHISMEEIDFL